MAKKQIERIRQAILANRGGLKEATDEQIITIFNSLDSETQKQYLSSIEEGKGKDAVSDKTKSNL